MAECRIPQLVDHVRSRIITPFLDPSTLAILTTPPTNKHLLSGPIIKSASKGAEISLVDVYGTLVASRLFVPDDVSRIKPEHLKTSHQAVHCDDGAHPLPIYSLIRHEVPDASVIAALAKDEEATKSRFVAKKKREEKQELISKSVWQWFELSPCVGPFCGD